MVVPAEAPFGGRRVLVTGGAGFIGRRLTAVLARSDAVVSVADASAPDLAPLQGRFPQIRCYELDVRDRVAVQQVVDATLPEYVFHLAAAGVSDPFLPLELALAVNLYGSLNVFRACFDENESSRRAGEYGGRDIRLVHTSTPYEHAMGADQEPCPISHYAASKAAASAVARMFHRTRGWPIVMVRPFQVYGPGQPAQALIPAAILAAKEGRSFRMTGGKQERDFVYVDDIVRGYLAAATKGVGGRSYDLGWGTTHTIRAVIDRLYALIQSKTQPLYGALPYRPGEIWSMHADIIPAAQDLGWYPQVSLDEGLSVTAESVLLDNALVTL
jgi:UDP-glucose 4-epimerase